MFNNSHDHITQMQNTFHVLNINLWKICIIDLCGWHKLQIAQSGIKINSKIPIVGIIYKSLTMSKILLKKLTYSV
jgi:hypothetical protein